MPIFGARELKLFLLVKRKYTVGNKYFLAKWGCILYVINVVFLSQYNNLKNFFKIIFDRWKNDGRHISLCYL